MAKFIHLRTYSDYSLGFSPIKVKDLVKSIVKLNQPAVALTDRNNMFASLEFAMEAKKSGLQPINGIDISVRYNDNSYGNILLIAKDEEGYENLIQIASDIYLNKKAQAKLAIDFECIAQNKSGIIALVANPINSVERISFNENKFSLRHLDRMRDVFDDNWYIELIRKKSDSKQDIEYEENILDYAFEKGVPVVATNYASFVDQQGYEAQDILSCIASGRYVIEDDRPKLPEDFYLKSSDDMSELFKDIPEACENTLNIAKRCSYASPARAPLLPEFAQGGKSADDILAENARDGLKKRIEALQYEIDLDEYQKRLEFELSIIVGMQYSGYFLIVSDFIKWSKANGIPVGPGRGSGVGSIVAWSVDITDLDPIKFGLLFERFLNPERVSMPDFDIDFCQERREEVIQYVRRRYGEDKVAQIITFGKLQARAVLRDVGRVIHLPYPVVDKICKMVPNNPANPVTLAEAIALDKELQKSRDTDPTIEKLLKISLELEGVNRHASTHAAGVVIGDRPISKLIPIYKDENSEMPAVQYTMKYAESAGLVKFDFLGLKTLTVTSHTEKLINRNNGNFSILSVSLEDPKTYELLSKGDTVGVFQFESAGMREAIKRLRPDNIGDLIALGSLYRP
ncbi:MAG: DNA polymerase III subunit alpha, partial [Alphaproteobacteria bacterium]